MKNLTVLSFALVLIISGVCLTQPASAQSDPRAEAYELYKEGVESYKNEDYEQAAEHLEQAVEIHKNPVVYYNLSLAYSKLGRVEDAMGASEMAASMEDEMPSKTALKNRARMNAYSAAISSGAVAEKVAADRAAAGNLSGGDIDTDLSLVGWSGVATAGVGAVLLGTALVMNGSIGNKIDNYEAALDDGEVNSANRLYDEINRQQTAASITFISGTALLVAGTGVLVYDMFFYEETPRARLGASVGPNSAAIDLSIRF